MYQIEINAGGNFHIILIAFVFEEQKYTNSIYE